MASMRFAFSSHCARVGSSASGRSSVVTFAVISPVTGARKFCDSRFTSAAISRPCAERDLGLVAGDAGVRVLVGPAADRDERD